MSAYEGEHTIFGLLGQANLTQNDVVQFHPFTSNMFLPIPINSRVFPTLSSINFRVWGLILISLIQERVGTTLELVGLGKNFLNETPTAQQLRDSIDKWDLIKLKSFCSSKEMVSKLKRTPTEWEKIFASYTSDKRLITRIYRELKKLNSPKTNEPIKKWASELNRTFSKEEIQMAKKHMKKCSPSLAIREMQIKTTLRFHLTPVTIAIISNTTNNRCWRG
jgi:hypothetical protein